MIPPKLKGKKCALYSIVCNSVLYFLLNCTLNPPDTGMTIIAPTDKAVDNVTMEINSN